MYRNMGLGSWIARRARMNPDRIALVFNQQRLDYRTLAARVTRLARALEQQGFHAGDRIAFLGYNHPAAFETLFACGMVGAIAVPIHPGFDEASLIQVLEDAAPAALVTTAELLAKVDRIRGAVDIPHCYTIGLAAPWPERYEDLVESASEEPLDRPIALDAMCLLAFSSGTTGRNKGVRLSHGNLLFNAVNTLTSLDYLHDDVILTSAPLYRMGGLGFSLAMLFKGGTCVIQERRDAEESLRLIEQHHVTVLFDAVGAYEAMLEAPSFAGADLSSLRIAVTGGSYVPPWLLEAYWRRGVRLQPGYGLTEAAPLVLLMDQDEVERRAGAAGRPPMFCTVRVVDRDLRDVAPGELGELLATGPNVMRGYWRNDAATAHTLVDGWLRTGDVAKSDPDGMVTVVGRVADALVLGGSWIHPGPIEEELRVRCDLLDCGIVQSAPDARPVLFVVPRSEASFDADRTLALCQARLGAPSPPVLRRRDVLPRNPNGKLLRTQLRALEGR